MNDLLQISDNVDDMVFIDQENKYDKLFEQIWQLSDDNITTLNLDKYNNNNIINALHLFIFNVDEINTKIENILINILKYVRDNSWNTVNFTKLQIDIVNNLFYYILKKNELMNSNGENIIKDVEILSDIVFKEYQATIIWNKNLYTHFLKLLTFIDFVECFDYIYNQAIDNNYVINLNTLFGCKYNNNITFNVNGIVKCIKISRYILTKINDIIERSKFINLLYDELLEYINDFYPLTVCLDCVIGYFDINNSTYEDNYLIYKYVKLDECEYIKDKIMKCIIFGKSKNKIVYDECIEKFKINPNTHILDAIKCVNNFYLTNFITINTHDEIYNLLFDISSVPIIGALFIVKSQYKEIIKIIRKFTHIRYINKLSQNQIKTIMFNATKNKNIFIVRYLFNYFIKNSDIDVIMLFKYAKHIKMIKLLINLCEHIINFNDKNLLHIYINNNVLLRCLLEKNMLDNTVLKILSDIVLNNNIFKGKGYMAYLIFRNLNIPFNNKICKQLYELHCYDAVCIYLKKNHEQANLNYNIIKTRYKKIINSYTFRELLFNLNLTIEQAHDLLSNIKNNSYAKNITFLIKNIMKIEI